MTDNLTTNNANGKWQTCRNRRETNNVMQLWVPFWFL